MRAICKNCGKQAIWRNKRGNRLADYTCECGGKYGIARYDHETGTYVLAKPNPNRGKAVTCALCGRRRRFPSSGTRQTETEGTYQIRRCVDPGSIGGRLLSWDEQQKTIPAGSIICWSHEPGYPVYLRDNKAI